MPESPADTIRRGAECLREQAETRITPKEIAELRLGGAQVLHAIADEIDEYPNVVEGPHGVHVKIDGPRMDNVATWTAALKLARTVLGEAPRG